MNHQGYQAIKVHFGRMDLVRSAAGRRQGHVFLNDGSDVMKVRCHFAFNVKNMKMAHELEFVIKSRRFLAIRPFMMRRRSTTSGT
jgi:hypothetical protein